MAFPLEMTTTGLIRVVLAEFYVCQKGITLTALITFLFSLPLPRAEQVLHRCLQRNKDSEIPFLTHLQKV